MSGGTSNFEIENALKPLGTLFGGVFAKDELPMKPDGKMYVINLGNRDTGGSHWVCVNDSHPKECQYFDSYGLNGPPEIHKFMSRSAKNKKLLYSDAQYQKLQSDVCGEFCCFVLLLLYRGFTYKQILEQVLRPNDEVFNESLVKGIIRRA